MNSMLRQVSRSLRIGGRLPRYSRRSYSYEGDGKTSITLLNDEPDSPLMIDSYHERGFRLNNRMTVLGSIAIFPRTIFSWNVGAITDVTPESLALFGILEPKLDILIIGVGDAGNQVDPSVLAYLRSKNIGFEILPTDFACQTFNFLSVEKRNVAAALIPPIKVKFYDDDVADTKRRRMLLSIRQKTKEEEELT